MTLKKICKMWSHDYTRQYSRTCVSVYSKKGFLLKFAHRAVDALGLGEELLDRKVVEFSVTETELRVVIDVRQKGEDHEFISPKEFYSLIDKSCIDLSDPEEWLEDLKEDEEECIKWFEFNPIRGELLLTYTNIPHCMP